MLPTSIAETPAGVVARQHAAAVHGGGNACVGDRIEVGGLGRGDAAVVGPYTIASPSRVSTDRQALA